MHIVHVQICAFRGTERGGGALTTLAALVVIESPPKKNEPHMTNSKIIAPVEL